MSHKIFPIKKYIWILLANKQVYNGISLCNWKLCFMKYQKLVIFILFCSCYINPNKINLEFSRPDILKSST